MVLQALAVIAEPLRQLAQVHRRGVRERRPVPCVGVDGSELPEAVADAAQTAQHRPLAAIQRLINPPAQIAPALSMREPGPFHRQRAFPPPPHPRPLAVPPLKPAPLFSV